MILYSFNKYKLFSFFFIFLFSTSNYFINETFYPNNESQIISLNNSSQKLVLNESTEKSKISDNNLNPNKRCFQTDNKIYWKNQIDLELEKSKKEIENSNLLKISFDNKEDFFKRENPKISLIITIYNQDYYIKESYSHIQLQELKDIEIIYVDDDSTDNSSSIIKELMKEDKRIVYLKNKINKRQFYSIARGILYSKGEYILSIDADDFLLNNILIKAYETAKYYDLDIVQFYMILEMNIWSIKYKGGIICGNENLRNLFYYGTSRNLPDKLIKRSVYINAINFMKKELLYEDYHKHTDDTFFFGIIHVANSYCFLEQIGYFYNVDPNRNLKHAIKMDKATKNNKDIKSLFNIMKYFILQSDNNTIEKNNIPYKFFDKKVKNKLRNCMKYINKDFDFYIDVLNLYINCPFFDNDKKKEINKFIRKLTIKKKYYK
jgi:glycosyltransferase involved in cell wall biosynthesis